MPNRWTIGLFVFLLAACSRQMAPPMEVVDYDFSQKTTHFEQWVHAPMHPDNGNPVKFYLSASDTSGIQSVRLEIYEYELFRNLEGLPSKRRRQWGQWGEVAHWQFQDRDSIHRLEYVFDRGFPANSSVEYIFVVTNGRLEESARFAMFDAGDSPWPEDKILLYATNKAPLKQKINMCFVADTDYRGDVGGFLSDTEQLIYQGYHQNNVIRPQKDLWNFYYTDAEVDGRAIYADFLNEAVFPDFVRTSSIEGVDVFALLHREEYSDASFLMGNIHFVQHNLFTSESYNWGTAVHETGHALFHLSDEYDGCACFDHSGPKNVFRTAAGCIEFNERHQFPIEDCSEIKHIDGSSWFMSEEYPYFVTLDQCEAFNEDRGYDPSKCTVFVDKSGTESYRSEPGLCIMQDDGDHKVRDFKRTCSAVIRAYYDALDYRFDPQHYDRNALQENIFDYEALIVLQYGIEAGQPYLKNPSYTWGVPTKSATIEAAVSITLANAEGAALQSIQVAHPGEVHIHALDYERRFESTSGTSTLRFPYDENAGAAFIQMGQDSEHPSGQQLRLSADAPEK